MKFEKLDVNEVEISCPDCKGKFKASVTELREARPLTCPCCHREIIDDVDYLKFLDDLENAS